MKNLLIIISAVLFLTSCEKEIEYKDFDFKNFLVLNSILQEDSLMWCSVSSSKSIIEEDKELDIVNAKVLVYKDDNLIDELKHRNKGRYFTENNIKVEQGGKYKISVSVEGFKDVEANTEIPEKPQFNINYFKKEKNKYNVGITINDKKGHNYYRLKTYILKDGVRFYLKVKTTDPIFHDNKTYVENENSLNNTKNNFQIFNDDLFDGENYELKFSLEYGNWTFNNPTLNVELFAISKELYLYYKTIEAYKEKGDNGDDPFSEPIKIFSNVKNGAGILGCSSLSVKSTKIN